MNQRFESKGERDKIQFENDLSLEPEVRGQEGKNKIQYLSLEPEVLEEDGKRKIQLYLSLEPEVREQGGKRQNTIPFS